MSTEYKTLCEIKAVTDTDTDNYEIGEVEGNFQYQQLRGHIRTHGINSLLKTLAYLQYQVISAFREINAENQNQGTAKNSSI